MPDHVLPPPSPEQRRIAAERFERARQVITTGNVDYGVQLLLTCCKFDPANLVYRQELRRAQKKKNKNNSSGGMFSFLTTMRPRSKMMKAKRGNDHLKVLELGEEILVKQPWDRKIQLDMSDAADAVGLTDVAIFILDQARQKEPNDPTINRALARVLEKRGHFAQAIKLWELVRKAVPTDHEAASKAKDLAASETIKRGHYDEAVASDDPIRTMHQHNQKQASDRSSQHEIRVAEKLAAEPMEPRHYIDMAANLKKAGKIDEAIDCLTKGMQIAGNSFELQLALNEMEIEPFRKNLTLTDGKLKSTPDDEELVKHRGHLLKEINSRELELFRAKADRNPGELQNRLELGLRLLRAGQTDEAISELQAARKDERLHGKAALYLGHCFKARNNWRLAQRNFEEALQKLTAGDEATRKDILFQLASGAAEAGDLAKAIDLGHELANIDFAYKDVGRLLDEWQSKMQKAG